MIANYRQAVQVGEPEPEVNFVEYVQSTGTQYIDTGFVPDNNTRIVIDIQATKAGTYGVFGGRRAYKSRVFAFWIMSGTEFKTDFGEGELRVPVEDTLDRVVVDKNKNICYVGSSPYTNTNVTFESPSSLTLFAVKDEDGSVDSRMFFGRIYSCKIYDNDVLVRDYLPARDPDGIPCLYEQVSKEYAYASGTGSLMAPASLDDVEQLSYIESSGVQYIDTRYKPNNNTKIVIDIEPLRTSTAPLFGAREGAGKASFLTWIMKSTQYRDDFGSNGHTISIDVTSVLRRIMVVKNMNNTSIGSYSVSHSLTSFQVDSNLLLFAAIGDGSSVDSRKLKGRLYSCKIYENDVLVRDYYPVKDPYGVVCLLDVVNSELVYNSGSGSFTAPS